MSVEVDEYLESLSVVNQSVLETFRLAIGRSGSAVGGVRSPFARQTVVYRPQIEVAESVTCSRTRLTQAGANCR